MQFEILKPTIQRIHYPLFQAEGIEVFIQREDLIHPFISGNKWRKLKYVLKQANQHGKSHLVSFGGPWSNHLVALACAGASYGFKTTGFVRGESVINASLALCKLWGMELKFISREAYRDKFKCYQDIFGSDPSSFFIDEGGKGELGVKGCEEMLDDVDGLTHVFCACGTGTTLAGIARSAIQKNMVAEGISVLKGDGSMDEEVEQVAGYKVKIHHGFSRRGYGKSDDELMEFIKNFASYTGILTDQVYTGKMLMAVGDLMEQQYFPKGSRILLIHTGGLTGLLGAL